MSRLARHGSRRVMRRRFVPGPSDEVLREAVEIVTRR